MSGKRGSVRDIIPFSHIDEPARQIRDPFVFEDAGRTYLFYSTCGEQGIAAAEIALP